MEGAPRPADAGGGHPGGPRVDEPLVELAVYPTRWQADAARALLADCGIPAMVRYGDADGWAPNFALLDGFRLCVLAGDAATARAVLDGDVLDLGITDN